MRRFACVLVFGVGLVFAGSAYAGSNQPEDIPIPGLCESFSRGQVTSEAVPHQAKTASTNVDRFQAAREVLGDDFIAPDEVTRSLGLLYGKDVLEHFQSTFPSDEVLRWLKANSYALVAGPPEPLSLRGVSRVAVVPIFSDDGRFPWGEDFVGRELVWMNWFAVRKGPVSGSVMYGWDDQIRFLRSIEYVPHNAEMAWFTTVYYKVRGVRLFETLTVRTSSSHADGFHVSIGYFFNSGFSVRPVEDNIRATGVGLASALQF